MEIPLFIWGYLTNLLATGFLLYRVSRKKSIYGLAADTQYCFLAATISRAYWISETRLVESWLCFVEVIGSLVLVITLCTMMYRLRHTTTKSPWWGFRWFILVPVAGALAFFFHPGKQWWTAQILVAFTINLEAMAPLSQLYLMRTMIEVEPLTTNYVIMLVISRAVRLLFWASLFHQGEQFLSLFLADLFHSILCVDYLYVWCKKLRHGGQLIYKL